MNNICLFICADVRISLQYKSPSVVVIIVALCNYYVSEVDYSLILEDVVKEIYEMKSSLGQDFFYEDIDSLTQMLRALATDGNKHRAKVDKRKQRSVFRDVLRAVEVGVCGARMLSSSFEVRLF